MTTALEAPASGTQSPLTAQHPQSGVITGTKRDRVSSQQNADVRGNPGAHDLLVARLLAELDRPRWHTTGLVRACDARTAIEGVLYGGRL